MTVYELLKDLVERNPEFDVKRHYVRLSDAPQSAAARYVRDKLRLELNGESDE